MMQIYTADQLWLRGTPAELRSYFAALNYEEIRLPLRQWLRKSIN